MIDINALIEQEAARNDQSEVQESTSFAPAPEGKTMARFVEYIELGKHPQEHKGEKKPDADEVIVVFDLLGAANIREIEVNGGKKKVNDRVRIVMPLKQNEKAKFFKLFKAMTYGRDGIRHMAQMLKEAYFVRVKHVKSADGKKTYANIYADQTWFVESPMIEDPVTGVTTNYSGKVPEAMSPLKVFFFDSPTKETWDSLFIDGHNEIKNADGTLRQESKNWIQEKIMSALNFGGSALEQMLSGLDSLPTTATETAQSTSESSSADAGGAEAGTTVHEGSTDADLAAMGL